MPEPISGCLWTAAQLPQLLEALAARAQPGARHGAIPRAPRGSAGLDEWFEAAAQCLALEPAPLDIRGFQVEERLRGAAPAVIALEGEGYLALLQAGRRRATLLRPDAGTDRIAIGRLAAVLRAHIEAPHREPVERLLDDCGIAGPKRRRAAEALLRERTRFDRAARLYSLRRPPGAHFRATAAAAGWNRMLALLLFSHAAEYLLLIAAWWVLGRAVLQGRADTGVLTAWALLLATMIPFRLLASSLQGRLAIGLGGFLRERLLDGALKLDADEVRHEGAGAFLGRAIEAEQVESLALSGGMTAALALLETFLSLCVLALGPRAPLQFAVLALWIAAAAWMGHRYYLRRREWTGHRLAITGHLIEAMTGHRTRLAQQPPEEWHSGEDRAAERYTALSLAMDRAQAWLGMVPRGYLVSALVALAPDFLAASPSSGFLAASLGAIILAWQAFRRMAGGMAQIAGAAIAWERVSDLFNASSRVEPAATESGGDSELVLSARDVAYRYPQTGRDVIAKATVEIRKGDWLLLEGPSGGGKSTLVSLLTGQRRPCSGLILAGGLDLHTLGGRQWRRRIVSAPQYHENHVLANTFAFNLLMGRGWPPREADLREAEEICRELGLGPLIDRMPGGLFQMVGETGWQLSQGERSRLFLARALLQSPELAVLDESFAALDPENLRQALETALRRSKTLLVVAHP